MASAAMAARLGFIADQSAAKITVYAGGDYVHEFKDQDRVFFVSGGQAASFANQRVRDYGEGVDRRPKRDPALIKATIYNTPENESY